MCEPAPLTLTSFHVVFHFSIDTKPYLPLFNPFRGGVLSQREIEREESREREREI